MVCPVIANALLQRRGTACMSWGAAFRLSSAIAGSCAFSLTFVIGGGRGHQVQVRHPGHGKQSRWVAAHALCRRLLLQLIFCLQGLIQEFAEPQPQLRIGLLHL